MYRLLISFVLGICILSSCSKKQAEIPQSDSSVSREVQDSGTSKTPAYDSKDHKSSDEGVDQTKQQTYRSEKYGFEINYPAPLKVKNNFDQFYILSKNWRAGAFGDAAKGTPVISIPVFRTESEKNYPRYFSTELRIGVSNDKKAIKSCETAQSTETALGTETINGVTFHKFGIADHAMMQYMEGISYRTFHNGYCYAIEQLKVGSNYKDETTKVDIKDSILNQYYQSVGKILHSFRFTQ